MTKHPSRKVINFRHLLGCDAIDRNSKLPSTLLPLYNNNKDVKHRFLQHLESIPKIKFECQEDEQLSNILELYFKIFQVRTIFFLETFTVIKLIKLIQLIFSNVR